MYKHLLVIPCDERARVLLVLPDNEVLSPVSSPRVPRHNSQPQIINRHGFGGAGGAGSQQPGRSVSQGQVRIMTSPQVILSFSV